MEEIAAKIAQKTKFLEENSQNTVKIVLFEKITLIFLIFARFSLQKKKYKKFDPYLPHMGTEGF